MVSCQLRLGEQRPVAWTGVVARVRCVSGELLTVASLNTRGIPLTGSRLAERYAVIGAGLDAGDVDVACFQEVFVSDHIGLRARLFLTSRSMTEKYWQFSDRKR